PALVRPSEGAVVAVPDGEATRIESPQCLGGDRAPAILPIQVATEIGNRGHRVGVEAKTVSGLRDRMGKRPQHRVLPLEVVLLRGSMTHAEGRRVRSHLPNRAVTQSAAEQDLELPVGQRVVLHRDEYLVADVEGGGTGW